MRLVWFRNDLRINAHTPLAQALDGNEPVTAVYLLCPDQWDKHQVSPIRRWYVLASLLELGESLAARGICLQVLTAGDFDQAPAVLESFIIREKITRVYCNREYPLNELERDRALAKRLRAHQIPIHGFDDGMLVPPHALRSQKGTPYTVYTPYRKRWRAWMEAQHPPAFQPKWPAQSVAFAGRDKVLDALGLLTVSDRLKKRWPAGEKQAISQLDRFVDEDIKHYKSGRDFPDQPATSLLSTALSAGTLSPSQAWHAARLCLADSTCREGAECWISELAWRDFYRQIMFHFPRLAKGQAFKPETELLPWRQDEKAFDVWCRGQTGYPLVDAAMRQLLETGWIHNRLRMLTAMFLSKHLFIDWRWGERFFMQHLIDGDFAANNGGWQWSASTGTDAVPYFRVFNPVRQSYRFDPDGRFIKRFVPELADLDGKHLHEPWTAPLLAAGYPAPIVNHQGVKQTVETAFKAAKAEWQKIQ